MQLADPGGVHWVRLVLAVSLDGRLAPPEGGAAQLGGDGDRYVLEQALVWADACLIGAGTLRAHQSTCLIWDPQLQQSRVVEGRPPQPAAVVVSHQTDFPQHWRFFQQPLRRWLLAPSAPVQGFDHWVPLAQTWKDRLQALASLGAQRLVLLGGAGLVADMLRADVVDELQLTLVPALLGGEHSWVPAEQRLMPAALARQGAWVFEGTESLGGEEVLVRYRRQRD